MPCAEVEQLVHQLADASAKELKNAPSVLLAGNVPESYVTAGQRDQAVVFLLKLSEHFGFSAETFGLAVSCLDRFLAKVKAQTRYLQCISLASLLIAAKLSEEEEYVPKMSDFVTVSRCSHTTADLRRMETVMLQKISWTVFTPTPVYFLQKYGELLVALGYFPKHLLTPLLRQCMPLLLQLMCQSTMMCHRYSVLALAVLNSELGNVERIAGHWVEELAKLGMVTDDEYIHCCGLMNDFLDLQIMIYHEGPVKKKRRRRRRKRSAGSVVRILPTIWEDYHSEQVDEEMPPTATNDDVEMEDEQISQDGIGAVQMIAEPQADSSTDTSTPDSDMILEDKDVRMAEYQQEQERFMSCFANRQGSDDSFHSPSHGLLQADTEREMEQSGKLLYSTVVKMSGNKMSCSKTVYADHSILSSATLQRQTLAY